MGQIYASCATAPAGVIPGRQKEPHDIQAIRGCLPNSASKRANEHEHHMRVSSLAALPCHHL
jgi:hypothetical protein